MREKLKACNMTAEEYFKLEEASQIRHEFVDGQIFAMTGSTVAHNVISKNLLRLLDNHLRGTGCRSFIAELKVRAEATNSFYYPDIVVTCKPVAPATKIIESPILIGEVLSPSTKHIDRREKVAAYRKIPSLCEYIIVYQDRMRVELHRKVDDRWLVTLLSGSDELCLEALPPGVVRSPVSCIYEGLDLPPIVQEDEEEYELA